MTAVTRITVSTRRQWSQSSPHPLTSVELEQHLLRVGVYERMRLGFAREFTVTATQGDAWIRATWAPQASLPSWSAPEWWEQQLAEIQHDAEVAAAIAIYESDPESAVAYAVDADGLL